MLRWITQHKEYIGFSSPQQYIRTPQFYAAVQASENEFALGITISKRVGKACLRNLLKRRIKHWIRQNGDKLPNGFKLNLVAKPGAGALSWQELCAQLEDLMLKLRAQAS
ncbi:MAG: ribonuclease P protein component [Candidatus Cloacimonadaceae bacterium]|nr:ribonuclease P protein component [Candidatus Cloacimonadaceae bacterium]